MWQPIDAKTGTAFTIPRTGWPVLIHGAPKTGASFFTVVLCADLIRRGQKVVLLCAQGAAIRALQTELGLVRPASKFSAVTAAATPVLEEMQVVTLLQRHNADLMTSLRALSDWSERVVVIKNAEQILSPQLWAVVQSHPKLIISGDFSTMIIDVDENNFPTRILFSTTPGSWHHQRLPLPTYVGDAVIGKKHQPLIVQELANRK